MKRIVMHWTAGTHKAGVTDKRHYHFIVEGDGTIVAGNNPVSANLRIANPNDGSTYAAHTAGANTGSIGVAMAAMRGAVERPFNPGPSPITQAQLDAFVRLAARLSVEYGIPVTPQTVLTHAEVQPNLGIKQRNKWDITWLPGKAGVSTPEVVGSYLRALIRDEIALLNKPQPATILHAPSDAVPSWAANLTAAIKRLFSKGS
jgi:hypothetical protein